MFFKKVGPKTNSQEDPYVEFKVFKNQYKRDISILWSEHDKRFKEISQLKNQIKDLSDENKQLRNEINQLIRSVLWNKKHQSNSDDLSDLSFSSDTISKI